MDLDLRYETAFAASPDILEMWEGVYQIYEKGRYDETEADRLWHKAYDLWNERYKFSAHIEAHSYWEDTRHGP